MTLHLGPGRGPGHIARLVAVAGGAAAAVTTWNPNDKSASITLSNGNAKATRATGSNSFANVRAATPQSSGKWYFEATFNALGSGAVAALGLSPASFGVDANVNNPNAFAYRNDGYYYTGDGNINGPGGTFGVGDVIGVAFDFATKAINVRRNNINLSTITYTGAPGALYPTVFTVSSGDAFTLSTVYAPPSGFSPWG